MDLASHAEPMTTAPLISSTSAPKPYCAKFSVRMYAVIAGNTSTVYARSGR